MKLDLPLWAQFWIMTLGAVLLGFVIPWVGYGINASFGIAACYFTPSSKECLEYRASICPGAASVCDEDNFGGVKQNMWMKHG